MSLFQSINPQLRNSCNIWYAIFVLISIKYRLYLYCIFQSILMFGGNEPTASSCRFGWGEGLRLFTCSVSKTAILTPISLSDDSKWTQAEVFTAHLKLNQQLEEKHGSQLDRPKQGEGRERQKLLKANVSTACLQLLLMAHEKFSIKKPLSPFTHRELTSNFCCSLWWFRVSGLSRRALLLSSRRQSSSKSWTGKASFFSCRGQGKRGEGKIGKGAIKRTKL